MLSVRSGHSASYLTGAVASGRENYYTGAVAAGEPPGRWSGRGAEALGLTGEVDTQDMTALYERFIDPRDEAFRDPAAWDEAETLGHTGRAYKTEEQVYAAALAREPGASAERRAELRDQAGQAVRKNVDFHDATFSPQKSVTVLHTAFEAQEVQARDAAEAARGALEQAHRTGDRAAVHRHTEAVRRADHEAVQWAEHRQVVEDAIWAGNQAALGYLADKAGYTREGHHGGAAGRWADAHDWTIASFFQHDSRDHDPQLHIHNAILNRVQGPDGKWRTLDSKALHRYDGAAGAVGERVMEQHLVKALGVQFKTRPDGKAREVVGIDQQVMDLFSSRRRAITKKTAKVVAEFEQKFGRQPNNLELARLQQTATLATRRAKSHDGETVAQRLERWDQQLRAEVRGGLGKVAGDVLALRQRQWLPGRINEAKVLETALAEVQSKHATWRASDLTRAINNALPDNLGNMKPDKVVRLLDKLTERGVALAQQVDTRHLGETAALPDELRRADGSSAYSSPGAGRYVTPDHLKAERQLARAGYARGAVAMTRADTDAFVKQLAAAGLELGTDQAAAVRGILASGAKVETLVGPAGTGKSRVVGALAKAWEDADLWNGARHRMVGLAASQVATEVLAADGVTAKNITRWLMTQQRIADGSASTEEQAWVLRDGDLVVVDESAMANTSDLAAIHAHCDAAGAKLLLVGDHRQLAAVGAGGGMELVTANAQTHELTETRRFTADWEGPASLRLRAGDESVLGEYHKQGRILDGGTIESAQRAAADAWLADHLAGKQTLLITDTNDQAAQVSAQVRAKLVQYGKVSDTDTVLLASQGTHAGRDDIVQARSNAWHLASYAGNRQAPINRERYRVLDILPGGDLVVVPYDGARAHATDHQQTMTLPASYVAEHLALGYAATVHSSQGLTVDTTHAVVTQNTSLYALYVAMSRGRAANTAHVVTQSLATSAEFGETADAAKRSPLAVLRAAFDLDDPQLSALQAAAESAAEANRLRTPAELLADGVAQATAGRTAGWLDELTDAGLLTAEQRTALAVEDGAGTLANLLRQVELAGHDPHQVLSDAIQQRSLDDARKISHVVQDRIKRHGPLDPVGDTYSERLPQVTDPQWAAYLAELVREADRRADELGEMVAAEQPQWAVEAFDRPPAEHGPERDRWIQRAGQVAAHRDVMGHEASDDALGKPPKPGQVEQYASWRAAWRALGRPEADRAEAEMSPGQLRVRVRAYAREEAWAPPYVGEELAGTRQAADRERRTATLRAAEADASTNDTTRQQLRTEAEQAEALAQALDSRAAELQIADDARAEWLAHTAETQAAAQRAEMELDARGLDNSDDGPTSEEWLDSIEAAEAADDRHREVTDEHELTDVAQQRDTDATEAMAGDEFVAAELVNDQLTSKAAESEQSADEIPDAEIVADDDTVADDSERAAQQDSNRADERAVMESQAPADLRQIAAVEERVAESDTPRVPSADESAEAVRRAQRALIEIAHRREAEQRHADDEAAADEAARDEELARWHADDTSTDRANTAAVTPPEQTAEDSGPVMELGSYDD